MTPYTAADAEADLRAALEAGDLDRITAASAAVDRLDEPRPVVSLHDAALWYVSKGLPVFPLRPGTKGTHAKCVECSTEPKCFDPSRCGHDLCHGLKDASTDPADINRWWDQDPRRNIGLATGHGFDAVDIDGPLGIRFQLDRWDDTFAKIHADALAKVSTPRPGGMHIWVPPTGDGNSQNDMPGVDYRGIGGYVVAPPSVIAPGGKDYPGVYRFLGTPDLDLPKAG